MKRQAILLLLGTELATPSPADAQEIWLTGPLRGAPAGRKLWRAKRLELAALTGLSAGSKDDPALLWGLETLYYPTDRFGAGMFLTGASPLAHGGDTTLRGFVSPELVAVPFAGVAHPFAQEYFRYDLHFHTGLGGVFAKPADTSNTDLAVWVGAGARVFSARFFSNSFDYRLVASEPVRHFVTFSFDWWPTEQHWDDE
ncbi:MAG TPA: hypothetical protein VF103_16760 [Polyangiaceae bacterium]